MTTDIFRCRHCGKLYEKYKHTCDWCSSPLELIELDDNKTIVYEWSNSIQGWVEVERI